MLLFRLRCDSMGFGRILLSGTVRPVRVSCSFNCRKRRPDLVTGRCAAPAAGFALHDVETDTVQCRFNMKKSLRLSVIGQGLIYFLCFVLGSWWIQILARHVANLCKLPADSERTSDEYSPGNERSMSCISHVQLHALHQDSKMLDGVCIYTFSCTRH